jgi:hypothetical protein
MNLKKKCEVRMVTTMDNTIIKLNLSNELLLNHYTASACPNQHLYFLSNDIILEDDWCLWNNFPRKVTNLDGSIGFLSQEKTTFLFLEHNDKNVKKIIASTDKTMSLGEPSPQFIQKYAEEYNKRNVIKEVNIEFYFYVTNEDWSKNPVQLSGYYTPKIDKNNFITTTKIKDNWDKKELIDIIKSFADQFVANTDTAYKQAEIDNWIEDTI